MSHPINRLRHRAPFGVVALVPLFLCDAALACRCAERPLAEYFESADEVVVARLVGASRVSYETDQPIELTFELVMPAMKSARSPALNRGDTIAYRTAATAAGCGVEIRGGATYTLFASRDDDPERSLLVDVCSGSRVTVRRDGTEVGFQDVPARFAVGQLLALASMPVLDSVVANWPDETSEANDRLVGLLDVVAFSHAGSVVLRAELEVGAAVVSEVDSYVGLETREVGYEEPAAVVYARLAGWYRLRTGDGQFGWLAPDQAGTYFPYPEVAVNRLNYISAPWHGFLWPSAGAGLPLHVPGQPRVRETPIEVLEHVDIGGYPWLRINVLSTPPCEGGERKVAATGWIPAFGPAGEPAVWYYSRGC